MGRKVSAKSNEQRKLAYYAMTRGLIQRKSCLSRLAPEKMLFVYIFTNNDVIETCL